MASEPATVMPPRYGDVIRRLDAAQKSSRGAPGYTRWVNRRLGRYVAAWAYLRGVTPNQLSAVNAVCTFAAIGLIAVLRPSWVVSILLALALLVGYVFDAADGQLARLRGGGSPAGEWLDHELDALKCASIHCAIAVAWFRFYELDHQALLLIPLAYVVVNSSLFFGIMLAEQLRRAARAEAAVEISLPAPAASSASVPASVLRSLIVLPVDYGVLCLAIGLLTSKTVFIPVYAILLAGNTVFLAAGCRRWYREMASFG